MPIEEVVLFGVETGPFLLLLEESEVLLFLGGLELRVLFCSEFLAAPVGGEGVDQDLFVLGGREELQSLLPPEHTVDALGVRLQGVDRGPLFGTPDAHHPVGMS